MRDARGSGALPEEALDVTKLDESASQNPNPGACWIGTTRRGPAIGQRAGGAITAADESSRLFGAHQRRGRGVVEGLQFLSALNLILCWLEEEPLHPHEADVTALERRQQHVVELL